MVLNRNPLIVIVAVVIIVISVVAVQIGVPLELVTWGLFFLIMVPLLLYPLYRNRDWILGRFKR